MSLTIKNVNLKQFRNYKEFSLENLGTLTIFVGKNAVGKTNIIEGIRLLTGISPLRSVKIKDYILDGEKEASVSIRVIGDNRDLLLKTNITEGKRKFFINEKSKTITEMRGIVPSVVFTPDDLSLVKGTSRNKRKALDNLGFQINANYAKVVRDYEQIVRQKNKLLKEEKDTTFLDSINEVVITCGTQLLCYRLRLFQVIKPYVEMCYREISGNNEDCELRYISCWGEELTSTEISKEKFRFALENEQKTKFKQEEQRGASIVGPHSDQIIFLINGKDASNFGSQGQQRSLVLAWKISEAKVIQDILGVDPILLLDDVMSELDETRRRQLTKFALQGMQTFITTTTLDYFTDELLSIARIIQLPHVKEAE